MDSYIKRFTQNDKFASYVGIELLEVSKGRAKAKLDIKPHHMNGAKIVHGAAIFSLADFVFAAASNSHGTLAVAVNVNISFLKGVNQGVLFAEAEEISKTPDSVHMMSL